MRRKAVHTRRGRAVRWLAAMLAALALCSWTGFHLFLPVLTVDRAAQSMGLEHMRVLRRYGTSRRMSYLSGGADALMYSAAYWDIALGWTAGVHPIVLWKDPSEASYAVWGENSLSTGDSTYYFLGFVPTGRSAPTFCLGVYPLPEEAAAYTREDFPGELTVIQPELHATEGGRYYLEVLTLPPPEDESTAVTAGLVQENGEILTIPFQNIFMVS